jgi:hypothetical protein
MFRRSGRVRQDRKRSIRVRQVLCASLVRQVLCAKSCAPSLVGQGVCAKVGQRSKAKESAKATAKRDVDHCSCPDFAATLPSDSQRLGPRSLPLIRAAEHELRGSAVEPEAAMKSAVDQNFVSVETIGAVIARSQIIVSPPVTVLPPGFDEADVAVLNWLAAEGARLRRGMALVH